MPVKPKTARQSLWRDRKRRGVKVIQVEVPLAFPDKLIPKLVSYAVNLMK